MDLQTFLTEWHNDNPYLLVHTSGSTGQPKPLWVEKQRMEASARLTLSFLGLQPGGGALLCLPLDYIAGKMMVVRSLVGALRLTTIEPCGHPFADLPYPEASFDLVAMVPMQVFNTLQSRAECERMKRVRHVIIGGGPVDDALAEQLKPFPNAIWSTYGMTETLSHIALRRLSGPQASSWYEPFSGVNLRLGGDGCLIVRAPQVSAEELITNDRAELHADGRRFRILGRRDNVVNSGGLKIQIEQVEQILRRHTTKPFIITRRPDPKLGEALVMLTETTDILAIKNLCQKVLPKYWQPRNILTVAQLPFTENGKPARAEAAKLAKCLVD